MLRKSVPGGIVLVVLFGLFGSGAVARDNNPLDTERGKEAVRLYETWTESVLDYDEIPGMAVAVVYDQELIYARGFGFVDQDRTAEVTPSTVFSICSISKLFTATAIMQLRDAGKLDLDTPVSTYLPWYPPEVPGEDHTLPTIRDLLRHSGGLPCEPSNTEWLAPTQLYPTREELIEGLKSLKLSYPPNTKHNYSNLGYTLLGEIISAVSGSNYVDYVSENILEPAGMVQTKVTPSTAQLADELAVGYSRKLRGRPRVVLDAVDWKSMIAAGGYFSTADDMAHFAMWYFRGMDDLSDGDFGRETINEMLDTAWANPPWGLGPQLWYLGDELIVGQLGGCPGYKSQLIMSPERKTAVAVLLNAHDAPQWSLAFNTYYLLAGAVLDPAEEDTTPSEWAECSGYYAGQEAWSDAIVAPWEGQLHMMWVPNHEPMFALTPLQHVEGMVFRMVNRDGQLGKHVVFGTDSEGEVIGLKFNNNLLTKTLE